MRVLFLDVDGVLNRVGYQPPESLGLRSWIEPDLASRLVDLLAATGAHVVLSSDWRVTGDLDELRAELAAAGVTCTLVGVTPSLETGRWREIQAYMHEHSLAPEHVAIVDDRWDMGPLESRFVRTSQLNGLDADAAAALIALWPGE